MTNMRRTLMGGGAALALVGGGLWLGAASMASGEGTATLVIDPASKNVAVGSDTFNVDIKVEDVNNLGAFDFLIKFNNDVLEYVGMGVGSYLTTTGRRQTCPGAQSGPAGQSSTDYANEAGALYFGCATLGLVNDGNGIYGPDGDGTLATLQFKPRAVGEANIEFGGLGADGTGQGEQIEPGFGGATQLANVEVCQTVSVNPDVNKCTPQGISVSAAGSTISVFDPAQPTPTGVPATPTKVVPFATPGQRATQTAVAAAGTPRAGRTPGTGTVAGGGTGGSGTGGSGTGGSGTAGSDSGSGGVAGAGTGRPGSGATGPNGAPIAGYGPQAQEESPWPARAGVMLALTGIVAMAGGAMSRRRGVQ